MHNKSHKSFLVTNFIATRRPQARTPGLYTLIKGLTFYASLTLQIHGQGSIEMHTDSSSAQNERVRKIYMFTVHSTYMRMHTVKSKTKTGYCNFYAID